MSLKNLFSETKNLQSAEPVSKENFKDEVESFDYAHAINKRNERFNATENFKHPYTFARFGSAEKYYEDTISNIYNSYPYDGSLKEKVLWEVSASLLDLYILENGYPRTTGYANFLTPVATSGEEADFYPPSGDDEYVLAKGGPHPGSGATPYYNRILDDVVYRKDANIYDLSENRENNLKIDGTDGNTVEFWLKKDAYVAGQDYFEFIFDTHVTGTVRTDDDYGRLSVALATPDTFGNSDDQAILVAYGSGSVHINKYLGSSALTTDSIADGNWHHYAVRMKTSGSSTVFDLFVDGVHNDTATDNATIDYVSGAIIATVGAQAAPFYDNTANRGSRGWSKLSGSLDEVRYWKTWRTSKKIQRYWFDQVGGGTNTDTSNTQLGVYYKFNEGITQTASIDSNVLDYSGRVSNGTWTGYGTNSRNTGSAILESAKSVVEFKDPIIYSNHPDVLAYTREMKTTGSVYDLTNANSLISFMPNWIIEENQTDKDILNKDHLWNLLQIIASYFDEASVLLENLPQLTHKKYYSGDAVPPPFVKKSLDSNGFLVPDIFINAELLERFENRDDVVKYESTLQEIKNIIYQNIYNNLDFIYKSKGTQKAFRNLFHCFGFGDNILNFNIYGDNSTYKLEDNLKFTSKIKNYINHNDIGNNDASVYQYKIDSNATSYISGSGRTNNTLENAGLAFTLESNVLLPNRVTQAEYSTVKLAHNDYVANLYPLHTVSSLFGMHSANGTENDLTWATNDYANFQVTTVKDGKYSSNAYFKLTGTTGGFIPELTSSLFEDVYDDQLWTVSVAVEPIKYPLVNQVSGAASTYYSAFSTTALTFTGPNDGTNEYLEIADADAFSFDDGSGEGFSVSFWFNRDDAAAGTQYFLEKSGEYIIYSQYIGSPSADVQQNLKLILYDGTGGGGYEQVIIPIRTTYGFNGPHSTWEHVVFTYDGRGGSSASDGISIYVNGVDKTSSLTKLDSATYVKMVGTSNPVRIGASTSNANGFKGKLDEFSMWSDDLTSDEAIEIYNDGIPNNLGVHSNYADTIAWWRMGDASSDTTSTIVDEKNSYDAAVNNVVSGDFIDPGWTRLTNPDSGYTVRFYGVNHIADYKAQEFLVTGTMTNDEGRKFMSSHKRVYTGAHRTNFTGSRIEFADTKINSCKAWMTSIPTGTIDKHSLKIGNYGAESPTENAYLYQDSISGVNVPQAQTLALLWDFSTVTGSDANGQFSVEDETSGSATDSRFGWLSDVVSRRHTASGSFFNVSSTDVVQSLDRSTYQAQVPEVLLDSNLTRILSEDDEFFNRNTRPVTYHLSIEKNMFQDISEEMLNMFGSVVYFNKLIGSPVNIYRGEYKELKKAADLFFEKVGNDYDFDKYVDYFKFIDYAVSRYVMKLIPASMLTFEDGISTVIENFVLGDRDKFATKYPLIKDVKPKEIVGEALGINEQLYDWKRGHAPLNLGQIQATATMTGILDNNTIPAALDSETIIIIDTVGLTKTYKFLNGGGKSTGDIDGGATVIQLSGEDTKEGLVDNIKQGVEHTNGHDGSIIVTRDGAVITLTQAIAGLIGNTIITFSAGINTSTELSKTNFVGGDNANTGDNCLWWQERAEINRTPTGDSAIDTDRQTLLDIIVNETNASAPTLYDSNTSTVYEGSAYATRRLAKPYRIKGINQPTLHGGGNQYQNKKIGFWDAIRQRPTPSGETEGAIITIEPPDSSIDSFIDCDDPLELANLKGKRKYAFSAQSGIDSNEFTDSDKYKGDMVAPFTLYSSSLDDNPSRGNLSDFQANLDITNLHHDSYGPYNDVPMQGPFTEKYVGGRAYRHVFTSFTRDNEYLDDQEDRLEGWILSASSEALDLKNPSIHSASSVYFRDGLAKRPVNIANIQQTTGAALTDDQYIHPSFETVIGNYSKAYELVMTNGRSINNRFLAESGGAILTASTDNIYVSGVVDFTLPRRDLTGSNKYVIVNRFSAPGDPATMAEGMLDVESGEYSVYNALPWRNLSVITPMNELLSDHCNQFGYFSDAFNSSSYVLAGETYPGGNSSIYAVQATATMTGILDTSGIPAALDTQTITIIDVFGTSKTYKFMNGGGKSTGDIDGGSVVIQLSGEDTKEGLVDNIKQGIETANGHNGSIIVTRVDAVITLTQTGCCGVGASGNTTITFSAGIDTSAELSKTNFTGGVSTDAYQGTGSFHKVNRNTRKILRYADEYTGLDGTVITASRYDNAFVTHMIPQSDMQYAWITGNTENQIIGYEQKDLSLGDYASSDIQFVSASDFVLYNKVSPGTNHIRWGRDKKGFVSIDREVAPVDFVGLNIAIYDPLTASNNTLGYDNSTPVTSYINMDGIVFTYYDTTTSPGVQATLNAINLHRNGPWGGANWKLYRKDSHPIVRYQKNHNVIGTSKLTEGFFDLSTEIRNFTEPPVTSKYNPLIYGTPSDIPGGVAHTIISHGNIRTHFTDHTKEPVGSEQLSKIHLDVLLPTDKSKQTLNSVTYSPYAAFKKHVEDTKDMTKVQVVYSETIYPKELYTYLSGTRKRLRFTNDFWRDDRDNRTALDYDNSYGTSIDITSIWKLDASYDAFTGNSASIPISGGMTTKDGVGELQNCYSLFHYAGCAGGGDPDDIIPAVNYNRRIKLLYYDGDGRSFSDASPFSSSRNPLWHSDLPEFPPDPNRLVSAKTTLFSGAVGDTLWETTSSRGGNPFYDSYDDYAEDVFRNMKNGTILPEYRISERMNSYVDTILESGLALDYMNYNAKYFYNLGDDDDGRNLKIKTGLLSLTGAITPSSSVDEFLARHTFSDFYKYFSMIEEDYEDTRGFTDLNEGETINVTQHKLVCEAILKFLPYDGFYPAERTRQLGKIFSDTMFGDKIQVDGADANYRTAMQPFYAPGILYNSIKSGIAVDYPVASQAGGPLGAGIVPVSTTRGSIIWEECLSGNFDQRITLDDMVKGKLPIYPNIYDVEFDADTVLNSTASFKGTSPKHSLALSNFLAASKDIFIGPENEDSFIATKEISDAKSWYFSAETAGTYTMDLVLRNSTNIISDEDFEDAKKLMDQTNLTASSHAKTGWPYLTSSLQVNTSSVIMYSRAHTGYDIDSYLYGSSFGPPVECGAVANSRGSDYGAATGDPVIASFDPFTPSYYNGYSKVRISIDFAENDEVDLNYILSNLNYSYDRLRTFKYPCNPGGGTISNEVAYANSLVTTAYKHAMQISASVYVAHDPASITSPTIVYIAPGDETKRALAFKPRWECPVLDFSGVDPENSYVYGNVAKGMWHQKGSQPNDNNYISLEVQSNTEKDLAALLGVSTKKKPIGTIKGHIDKRAKFSEAIIAIPYKVEKVNGKETTIMYDINPDQFELIRENIILKEYDDLINPSAPIGGFGEIQKKAEDDGRDLKDTSLPLYNMAKMMRKYVIPPHLDFLHNKTTTPFVMFMMEFEIDLTQKDLENIWQNVEPTFAKQAIKATSETSFHQMPTTDAQKVASMDRPYFTTDQGMSGEIWWEDLGGFFPGKTKVSDKEAKSHYGGAKFKPEETRWAVFKVKKRAPMNYNSILAKGPAIGIPRSSIRQDLFYQGSSVTNEFLYSYNWPYDFFSLIELAKLDSITTFNPNYNDSEED